MPLARTQRTWLHRSAKLFTSIVLCYGIAVICLNRKPYSYDTSGHLVQNESTFCHRQDIIGYAGVTLAPSDVKSKDGKPRVQLLPWWCASMPRPRKDDEQWIQATRMAAGFPVLAVYAEPQWDAEASTAYAWVFEQDRIDFFNYYVLIPYGILYRGFAANTAIIYILISLPFTLHTFLRNRSRRRQNRCFSCGYHLSGITTKTCPECGTNPIA